MKKNSKSGQHIVYGYLRAKDSGTGKAGSPYYIGIGNSYARAYERHIRGEKASRLHDVPVPKDESLIRQLGAFPTRAGAAKREQELIARYGRKGIDDKGILLNRSAGGDNSAYGVKKTPAQLRRMGLGRKEIRDKAKKTRMDKIAIRLGIDPEVYGKMGQSRREAMKAWVILKPGRTAQGYLDWWASGGVRDMSAKGQAWADRVGLPLQEWLSISDPERSNIQSRYGKGLRGKDLFRAKSEAEKREATTLTKKTATARKYGVPVEKYLLLDKKGRHALAIRYFRGKRGAALTEELI